MARTSQTVNITPSTTAAVAMYDDGGAGLQPMHYMADGANVAQGSTGDAAGTSTVIGLLKQLAGYLGSVLKVNPNTVYRTISVSFTRPANITAYGTLTLIANSTTAGSVVPMSFAHPTLASGDSCQLLFATVRANGQLVSMANLSLYLFSASPTVTVGDGGTLVASNLMAANGQASYLAQTTITNPIGFSDGAVNASTQSIRLRNTSGSTGITFYALLASGSAFTPNSGVTFTVELTFDK